ncbi:hypothetical protein ACRAWD_04690 [Caulobacter segnis]
MTPLSLAGGQKPAHDAAFRTVEHAVEAAGALTNDPEVTRMRRQALERTPRRHRVWSLLAIGMALLALAVVGARRT